MLFILTLLLATLVCNVSLAVNPKDTFDFKRIGEIDKVKYTLVRANQLTIGHVVTMAKIVSETKGGELSAIKGIHQKDNEADVYYMYSMDSDRDDNLREDRFKVIRFNSGPWYLPEYDRFVLQERK